MIAPAKNAIHLYLRNISKKPLLSTHFMNSPSGRAKFSPPTKREMREPGWS